MRKRYAFAGLSFLFAALTAVGSFHAYALTVREANDGHFSFGGTLKHTVTYYLPTHSNEGDTNFTSNTVQVNDGTNLYTALSSYTTAKGNYSFECWHSTKNHFPSYDESNDEIASSTTVTSDMTVYAKYAQQNVGYYNGGSDVYLTSSVTDREINSQYFFYGKRIYSVTGVDGAQVDLGTANGLYNLTKASNNWSVLRRIRINLHNVSWWDSTDAKTFVYMFGSSDSSTTWSSVVTYTSGKALFSAELKYTKFIVVRAPSSKTSGTFDDEYNQTTDVSLSGYGTGSNIYGSANGTGGSHCYDLFIGSGGGDKSKEFSWWYS